MAIHLEMAGVAELKQGLNGMEQGGPQAAIKGLYKLAHRIMRDAKQITPVDKGILRASGTVLAPEIGPEEGSVTLGFGGAASAYALVQHENMLFKHEPPGQALYLETAVRMHAPEAADAMRQAMDEFMEQWAEASLRAKLLEGAMLEAILGDIGTAGPDVGA